MGAGLIVLVLATAAGARTSGLGSITGKISDETGGAVSGVTVSVEELPLPSVTTDADGRFSLSNLEPGSYTLVFTLGDDSARESVTVADAPVEVHKVVDWIYLFAETITVRSASRRRERIVDAPAAITAAARQRIEHAAPTGQLPRLFLPTVGVESAQSGLFDFKFNVRGINHTGNRRLAVLIDGRNPSLPTFGNQEWAAVSFPLDDLASAELVRGPSSALYGANAFNGVLNLITKAPRDSLGGRVRLTAGDLDTRRLDFRAASGLGGEWFVKAVGGFYESDDFSRSRNRSLEYSQPCTPFQTGDCLFLEAAPLAVDGDTIYFGGLRFDSYFDGGRSLVVEGGTADVEGWVFATSGGRFQITDVERPWARFDFHAPRWNLLAYYTGREADLLSLAAGTTSFLDSSRSGVEIQGHSYFARGRGRVVAGLSLIREEVDSADPGGVQTVLPEPTEADLRAVFAQVDRELGDRLKLVVAARWDDNNRHSAQLSPKGALVYSPAPEHKLSLRYNKAFLAPAFPDLFLRVPISPPIDLSFFEGFCAPSGVDCGFGIPVPVLVVGNEDLEVESIESVEVGYNAILGNRAFLTVDYYRSEVEDFVRFLVPQLGTRLGRANPSFGPYRPPSTLPPAPSSGLLAALEAALGPLFGFLSNTEAGDPVLVLASIANFGRVETQGVELALDYAVDSRWSLELNYSWLDFDVREDLVGAPLAANTAEHKLNAGATFSGSRLAGSLYYRWVDSFRWIEGTLRGPVPSYGIVDLTASYRLSDAWSVGLHLANGLDDEHYEVFSGDLLGRRLLLNAAYSW